MTDELDLEMGDEARADALAAQSAGQTRREQRRAEREARSKAAAQEKSTSRKSSTTRKTRTSDTDGEVTSRLGRVLDRIIAQLRAREDEELASAIEEDKQSIVAGFVSVTRGIPFLRNPFIMVLNLVEPIMAFWRVGGILVGRAVERRARRMQQTPEPYYTGPVTDAEVVTP